LEEQVKNIKEDTLFLTERVSKHESLVNQGRGMVRLTIILSTVLGALAGVFGAKVKAILGI
jgi:hypothetical protein